MICVDVHLHTRFSFDASITPKYVADSLNANPVVKGVAITDHNTLEGYLHVRRFAAAYPDVVIVPGVEVGTTLGDVIVLGVTEKPAYWASLESVIDFAKARNGVLIVPHPFRGGGIRDAAKRIPSGLGAIEVLNPDSTEEETRMADMLAKATNLPGVGGSDAHHVSQMWKAYTEIDADPNVDSILKAIKNNKVKAVLAKG
ncbi:MAG TPA: PHP-associated domain-containing protein [Candidatus Bathyarchaeia archaeon]|nr:PHP-associated domain-containing protein [Candidatus Bathyarchaeia archaeon]